MYEKVRKPPFMATPYKALCGKIVQKVLYLGQLIIVPIFLLFCAAYL